MSTDKNKLPAHAGSLFLSSAQTFVSYRVSR